MLCRIFQYPLTKVRFLCYLVHGELLCGELVVRTPILPQLGSLFFCSCYLCIVPQQFHGQPFHLLPWQEKIIRDVFGTVRDDDPTMRQYTTAYIEIPKKNGKSELGAAIALNMLINDDEWKAEVYSCASDRQQAAIVFDVAVDMVRQSPALMKRVKIIPSTRRMIYQPTGSIYQVLSSEVATKHGLNVSACIFDELHTQPTRALYDVMTQGSGDARRQPLWFS